MSTSSTSSEQLVSLRIAKDYLGFSAAHFTIFSATERERLHGHSFRVQTEVTAPVDDNGLTFNYVPLKRDLKALCDECDERLLLPDRSPYLRVDQTSDRTRACFNGETMILPSEDVLLLPVRNITIEELSYYFTQRLLACDSLVAAQVRALTVAVSSGVGQWGRYHWRAT